LDEISNCTNPQLVKGSCGDPKFFSEDSISGNSTDKLADLFEKVSQTAVRNVTIIIGAIYEKEYETGTTDNIVIHISPATGFSSIDDAVTQIDKGNKTIKVKALFPLNVNTEANKKTIDIIINMSRTQNIILINKMCGSCFGSFWYLLNSARNFTYVVNPAQGTNSDDTDRIMKCFH
jgi:hypothetical protein